MIVRETMGDLVKTYSNKGMMIRQIGTGNLYSEAIDLLTSSISYEETDIPSCPEDEISDSEALAIIMGVNE